MKTKFALQIVPVLVTPLSQSGLKFRGETGRDSLRKLVLYCMFANPESYLRSAVARRERSENYSLKQKKTNPVHKPQVQTTIVKKATAPVNFVATVTGQS